MSPFLCGHQSNMSPPTQLVLLSPIYHPTPATPPLSHSPLSTMDTSDSSSDDGDHPNTPLQLPDSNTTIASHSGRSFALSTSESNESTGLFDFAQPKYLPSSHVSRSVSSLFPEEQHSHLEISTKLSSSHHHADLSHNALQLEGAYQPVLTSRDSQFTFSSPCESTPPPYHLHDKLPSVPFPPPPRDPSPSCTTSSPRISRSSRPKYHVTTKASAYSRRFPRGHLLTPEFVQWYHLGDELGAGGYGFVMTAIHRLELREVAVKFIIKAKVPEHAWMEDKSSRRVPTEALLLGLLDHPNIVKCLDLFEDELYFYLASRHIMTLSAMVVLTSLLPCHRYRNSMVVRGCHKPTVRHHTSWSSCLERPHLISRHPH